MRKAESHQETLDSLGVRFEPKVPRVERSVLVLAGAMVLVIVSVDVTLFRHDVWSRLLANVGIVLVFGAIYLRFFHHH